MLFRRAATAGIVWFGLQTGQFRSTTIWVTSLGHHTHFTNQSAIITVLNWELRSAYPPTNPLIPNPHHLMTHVIPQTVTSVLALSFIQAALEIFRRMGCTACVFSLTTVGPVASESYSSESWARWPVTFDVRWVRLGGLVGLGNVGSATSLVSHDCSHWQPPWDLTLLKTLRAAREPL